AQCTTNLQWNLVSNLEPSGSEADTLPLGQAVSKQIHKAPLVSMAHLGYSPISPLDKTTLGDSIAACVLLTDCTAETEGSSISVPFRFCRMNELNEIHRQAAYKDRQRKIKA
ncbi:hypothetical protein AVEN_132453-1, partial [Araneus ventricosus]